MLMSIRAAVATLAVLPGMAQESDPKNPGIVADGLASANVVVGTRIVGVISLFLAITSLLFAQATGAIKSPSSPPKSLAESGQTMTSKSVTAVNIGSDGIVHIVRSDGTEFIAPKEKDQVSSSSTKIADDKS